MVFPIFVFLKSRHKKADGTVHPGDDGNIPDAAVIHADGSFFAGNQSAHAATVYNKVVAAVADNRPPL